MSIFVLYVYFYNNGALILLIMVHIWTISSDFPCYRVSTLQETGPNFYNVPTTLHCVFFKWTFQWMHSSHNEKDFLMKKNPPTFFIAISLKVWIWFGWKMQPARISSFYPYSLILFLSLCECKITSISSFTYLDSAATL